MKTQTRWQRQIRKVIEALVTGATKVEQIQGSLFQGYGNAVPQACALGAVYVDGKNVVRLRSVTMEGLYKEHPVLRTEADGDDWTGRTTLADQIIELNDGLGFSFARIVSYLRKLARFKSAPAQWPSAS